MKQLTEKLIHESFSQTGVDAKYYSLYEAKVKTYYEEIQQDQPDEEDTPEDNSCAAWSIRLSNKFIVRYANEKAKGHGEKWATAFARYIGEENEIIVINEVLDTLEDKAEKERELEIHANSLSEDTIFKTRYKTLVHEWDNNAYENAIEFSRIYHDCIANGKNEAYARAYANAVHEYDKYYREIYAKAYEVAIMNGENELCAVFFGDSCVEAVDHGLYAMAHDFSKEFKKDWQQEFYLKLVFSDIEEREKRQLSDKEKESIRMNLLR